MTLSKPYFRIIRPYLGGYFSQDYIFDERYSNDRYQLFTAYKTLERDLERLFEYIEPSDVNFRTYSHRTFELLLRICTEVEANCKQILKANGYISSPKNKNWDMNDYKKINSATKLSSYQITFKHFHNGDYKIKPFLLWREDQSPTWYKAYNDVKHDRYNNFESASFENVINAMAGLLALLFSQFFAYYDPENESSYTVEKDSFLTPNGMYIITPPSRKDWPEAECYDFQWHSLKKKTDSFEKFNFNT